MTDLENVALVNVAEDGGSAFVLICTGVLNFSVRIVRASYELNRVSPKLVC